MIAVVHLDLHDPDEWKERSRRSSRCSLLIMLILAGTRGGVLTAQLPRICSTPTPPIANGAIPCGPCHPEPDRSGQRSD